MSKGFLANCDVNSVESVYLHWQSFWVPDLLMLVNSTFKSWCKINQRQEREKSNALSVLNFIFVIFFSEFESLVTIKIIHLDNSQHEKQIFCCIQLLDCIVIIWLYGTCIFIFQKLLCLIWTNLFSLLSYVLYKKNSFHSASAVHDFVLNT